MNYNQNINLNELLSPAWVSLIDTDILNKTNILLNKEIDNCKKTSYEIYPYNIHDIFNVFNLLLLDNIKVVIIGQDPYHSNKLQANGIAFSVNKGVTIPPSLRNIYKEMSSNFNCEKKLLNGDLTELVKQGVFLLNASLTVKQKHPNSHASVWQIFTNHIIDIISKNKSNIIFIAWGSYASDKLKNIDQNKHTLITTSHPSPLSCYKTEFPFIGSNIFTKINDILINNNKKPIKWIEEINNV